MSAQNWDNDMWAIRETTPERGLIIQINIQNSVASLTARIPTVTIKYELEYGTMSNQYYPLYSLTIPNVLVPQKQTFVWYSAIIPPNTQFQLGNYYLRVSYILETVEWYGTGSVPFGNYPTNGVLEPYPLDFRVASEQELQTNIQQYKQRGTNIYIIFNEPIIQIGGIGSLVAIGYYAYHRHRKK